MMEKGNAVEIFSWKSLKGRTSRDKKTISRIHKWFFSRQLIQKALAQTWMISFVFIGFLLGKATMLGELSPFGIAYLSVISFMRRQYVFYVGGALFMGSMFAPFGMSGIVGGELFVYYFLFRAVEKYEGPKRSYAPGMVFLTVLLVELFYATIGSYFTWYKMMMIIIDCVISGALTLVFIQAFSTLTNRKKNISMRNEEILSLIILLASVMTGIVGWKIYSLGLDHIVSRYLILLFACVAGSSLAASVGIVSGLILSLSNMTAIHEMSLLAFSGMLAGMLKDMGKVAVSVGMLLGASILSIYFGGAGDVVISTCETLMSIILFICTPKKLLVCFSTHIPGTPQQVQFQYDYAKRIRDITAERVNRFSQVFRQLSLSFDPVHSLDREVKSEENIENFMNAVAESTCSSCFKRHQCWDSKFMKTYSYMTEMMNAIENNPQFSEKETPSSWHKTCIKVGNILEVMKAQYSLYQHNMQWKRQLYDSRNLVAQQLSGVSQVMEDLAKEIRRERDLMVKHEQHIRYGLEKLGLSIYSIDIVNLEFGNVEIKIVHGYVQGFDECRKIIAPLLSDILDEHIAVLDEQITSSTENLATVTFVSAKSFQVCTGVRSIGKLGSDLSGDSYSTLELGNGTYTVLLSDGMGNGERARMESSEALAILEQLLQSGMDEKLAIKSVNSVLLLRSPDEIYATVDMALVDQYTAKTTFVKIGSTPSFIKRGAEVISVVGKNLPIGIIQDIEIDLVSVQLYSGDILIMMTDGIYDAPGYAVNKELWMKRMIQEIETDDPQQLADELVERVIRYQQNHIHDDMTIVVSKIEHYRPEWAKLHLSGVSRIERARTVS